MSRLFLERCTSNLKYVALTVLELLAFNAQKFRGSRDPRSLLEKFLRDHVLIIPGIMHVRFEVHSFKRFKLISLTALGQEFWPLTLKFGAQKHENSRPHFGQLPDLTANNFEREQDIVNQKSKFKTSDVSFYGTLILFTLVH